jgi:FAD/FMN-containing dehydrogenase
VKLASSEGWTIVPAGAATWLDAGNSVKRVNVIVSTQRLNRIIEHEPADLVAVTETGVTLNDFNCELARNGQWLPIDPPDDGRATIGGVVATGLGGAQQFGYGLPRRHVIGMKVVMADGTRIKVGGRVVKNVAGYDLCKLFTGSYGTLGVIVEVNFKLRPLPFETRTILAAGRLDDLFLGATRVMGARLFPVAIELVSPAFANEAEWHDGKDHLLLIRFAGSLNGVSQQTKAAGKLLKDRDGGGSVSFASGDQSLWNELASLPLRFSKDLVWRVGLRPADIGTFLTKLDNSSDSSEFMWHAGIGTGRIRVLNRLQQNEPDSPSAESIARIETFRTKAQELGGALIIENASTEIKNRVDAWGNLGPSAGLMKRIKQELDPCDIFSPGTFGFQGLANWSFSHQPPI